MGCWSQPFLVSPAPEQRWKEGSARALRPTPQPVPEVRRVHLADHKHPETSRQQNTLQFRSQALAFSMPTKECTEQGMAKWNLYDLNSSTIPPLPTKAGAKTHALQKHCWLTRGCCSKSRAMFGKPEGPEVISYNRGLLIPFTRRNRPKRPKSEPSHVLPPLQQATKEFIEPAAARVSIARTPKRHSLQYSSGALH